MAAAATAAEKHRAEQMMRLSGVECCALFIVVNRHRCYGAAD